MILPSAETLGVTLALAAATAYAVPAMGARRFGTGTIRLVALLAWILHGLALAVSMFSGPPRFGFAPALSVTAWLAAAVYAMESSVYPALQTRWTLYLVGTAVVLLALVFPGSLLHAKASFWLPLHWGLGIASYGMFAVAVAHGWLMTRAEKRMRLAVEHDSGIPLMTLERLTFRFVTEGFLLLSATILVVLFFSEQLYGVRNAWRWDHKTIFSLLSWLTFAVLIIGRLRFGWRGRVAVRMLYAGAGLLLLGYVGSRFVMEVVLGRTG
jgi:ABC-type uncharacterized transport system permease subunit